MPYVLRRPRTTSGRLAALVVCLLAPVPVAVLMSVILAVDVAVIAVAVCFAAGLVAASQLVHTHKWWTVAAAVAAILAGIVASVEAPDAVLRVRGEQVTAVVVQRRVTTTLHRRGPDRYYHYTLTGPDGPIPGELVESVDRLAVGDRVRMVVDPSGWVRPRRAVDVATFGTWVILAVAGLLVAAVAMCVPAVVRQPSESGPNRHRTGLWIYRRH